MSKFNTFSLVVALVCTAMSYSMLHVGAVKLTFRAPKLATTESDQDQYVVRIDTRWNGRRGSLFLGRDDKNPMRSFKDLKNATFVGLLVARKLISGEAIKNKIYDSEATSPYPDFQVHHNFFRTVIVNNTTENETELHGWVEALQAPNGAKDGRRVSKAINARLNKTVKEIRVTDAIMDGEQIDIAILNQEFGLNGGDTFPVDLFTSNTPFSFSNLSDATGDASGDFFQGGLSCDGVDFTFCPDAAEPIGEVLRPCCESLANALSHCVSQCVSHCVQGLVHSAHCYQPQ